MSLTNSRHLIKKIVLFISGTGSNMENIISYFKNSNDVMVSYVFSNKPHALGVKKAKKHNVPVHVFNKTDLTDGAVGKKLKDLNPDLIVLAGFLLKIPQDLVKAFPSKIINIHPALLPKYGGKGMYGTHVHQAVLNNKDTETGITIHYVNEHYDKGNIIAQFSRPLTQEETVESIKQKVHGLEMKHFPEVIKNVLKK